MIGSLVVVFPTPHEGGSLVLRHRGMEDTVDSGALLKDTQVPSIAYAAFFSDVEHEVTPITSGYRITHLDEAYVLHRREPEVAPIFTDIHFEESQD